MGCPYCEGPCPVGYGYCHCGCGANTNKRTRPTRDKKGNVIPAGQYGRYLRGHHLRKDASELEGRLQRYLEHGECPHCEDPCGYTGICHCGCGTPTAIEQRNRFKDGIIQGMPRKWIRGHYRRVLTEEEVQEIRYLYATEEAMSQKKLAERFGVSQMAISKVVLFDTWETAGIKSPDHNEEHP